MAADSARPMQIRLVIFTPKAPRPPMFIELVPFSNLVAFLYLVFTFRFLSLFPVDPVELHRSSHAIAFRRLLFAHNDWNNS